MVELNLNDKNNLNPDVNKIETEEEKRKRIIDEWNNKPVVKENGFEAIDKKKERKIGKYKLEFLKVMTVIGVLSIFSIAALFFYGYYKTGEVFPKSICSNNLTCGHNECVVPKSPDCVCGACNLTCGTQNITLSPIINLTVRVVNGS